MNENIIITILTALFAGAGAVWLFMQGLLKTKETNFFSIW